MTVPYGDIVLIIGNLDKHLEQLKTTLTKAAYRVIAIEEVNCLGYLVTPYLPDLIILDSSFKNLQQAMELLRNLKTPEQPLVLMATCPTFERDELIDEMLTKSASPPEILARVRSLLEIRQLQLKLKARRSRNTLLLKEDTEQYNYRVRKKAKILIVEDSKLQSLVMEKNLGTNNYEIITVKDGTSAIQQVYTEKPDLIILDIILPGMDGFTVCEKLKSSPATVHIPILIITTLESLANKIKGLKCGADDYLIKPIDKLELQVRVNSLLRKKHLHDQLMTSYRLLLDKAARDGLTGLYNKQYFLDRLQAQIKHAKRDQKVFSLVMLDIDYFKNYNDTNGHRAGDEVLRQLAHILLDETRGTDLVARFGGEEFIILLPEINKKEAAATAERIRQAVESHPFNHRQRQPGGKLTASLGVAAFPADGETADTLVEKADQAMYRAKKEGKNQSITYKQCDWP